MTHPPPSPELERAPPHPAEPHTHTPQRPRLSHDLPPIRSIYLPYPSSSPSPDRTTLYSPKAPQKPQRMKRETPGGSKATTSKKISVRPLKIGLYMCDVPADWKKIMRNWIRHACMCGGVQGRPRAQCRPRGRGNLGCRDGNSCVCVRVRTVHAAGAGSRRRPFASALSASYTYSCLEIHKYLSCPGTRTARQHTSCIPS